MHPPPKGKRRRQTDRQTDRQAGRQAGRQTDRDRQTDRHRDTEIEREDNRAQDLKSCIVYWAPSGHYTELLLIAG